MERHGVGAAGLARQFGLGALELVAAHLFLQVIVEIAVEAGAIGLAHDAAAEGRQPAQSAEDFVLVGAELVHRGVAVGGDLVGVKGAAIGIGDGLELRHRGMVVVFDGHRRQFGFEGAARLGQAARGERRAQPRDGEVERIGVTAGVEELLDHGLLRRGQPVVLEQFVLRDARIQLLLDFVEDRQVLDDGVAVLLGTADLPFGVEALGLAEPAPDAGDEAGPPALAGEHLLLGPDVRGFDPRGAGGFDRGAVEGDHLAGGSKQLTDGLRDRGDLGVAPDAHGGGGVGEPGLTRFVAEVARRPRRLDDEDLELFTLDQRFVRVGLLALRGGQLERPFLARLLIVGGLGGDVLPDPDDGAVAPGVDHGGIGGAARRLLPPQHFLVGGVSGAGHRVHRLLAFGGDLLGRFVAGRLGIRGGLGGAGGEIGLACRDQPGKLIGRNPGGGGDVMEFGVDRRFQFGGHPGANVGELLLQHATDECLLAQCIEHPAGGRVSLGEQPRDDLAHRYRQAGRQRLDRSGTIVDEDDRLALAPPLSLGFGRCKLLQRL